MGLPDAKAQFRNKARSAPLISLSLTEKCTLLIEHENVNMVISNIRIRIMQLSFLGICIHIMLVLSVSARLLWLLSAIRI
jgi:hypothetical protein